MKLQVPPSLRFKGVSVLFGLLGNTAFVCSSYAAAQTTRPNIVFFLIDDLGWKDVGFNGSKEVRTPNIDNLAYTGAILDAHYVQPVCSPTRSAIMTGRYPTHTGVYDIVRPHSTWGMPLNERTLANALKESGYETAITGKWHLGEFERTYTPTSRGFDHQYGHYFGAIDYFTHTREKSHDWYRDDKESKEEGYSTHLVSKEACRLIAEKDATKPLFLYVPFNGVHTPLQVPEKYMEPFGSLTGQRRALAGMLSAVDEAIGQIVGALENAGIRENTLIVFSSDNGGPSPGKLSDNGGLRSGKGTLYEGGVRVCAFANWPGRIPGGVRLQEPMHGIDWFPTFVKLGGGVSESKLPLDGMDVWPMLTQGAASPHEAILVAMGPARAALRIGDWKLMLNASSQGEDENGDEKPKGKRGSGASSKESVQLYNLATDSGEKEDRATQEPERVVAMRAKLDKMLAEAVASGSEADKTGAYKKGGKEK